jgi:hypothetical protein
MKRFHKMMLRAGLAAMAVGMAGSASAAQFLVTYTGTVRDSFVNNGDFGAVAPSGLDGTSFVARYTFDFPNVDGQVFANSNSIFVQGGSQFGRPSILSGTLTINSFTKSVAGGRFGRVFQSNGALGAWGVGHQVTDRIANDSLLSTLNIQSALFSFQNHYINDLNIHPLLTYNAVLGDANGGSFNFSTIDLNGVLPESASRGFLIARSVSISNAPISGAVPEPASWALMIAGFGLVGGAMRRRVTKVSYA